MRSNKPSITIGITCFREGYWLRECWDSVLAQCDQDWNAVLVMDGGATFETKDEFNKIEHPRLEKIELDKNYGCPAARNVAFSATKTEFHFYLDADDLLTKQSIRLMRQLCIKYPDGYFFYGLYEPFLNTGLTLKKESIWRGAGLWRRDVWEMLGGFAIELTDTKADLDLHIAAQETGLQCYQTPEIFYRIRMHDKRISYQYEATAWKYQELVVKRHPKYFSSIKRRMEILKVGYQRSFEYFAGVKDYRSAVIIYKRARSEGISLCDPLRYIEMLLPEILALVIRFIRFRIYNLRQIISTLHQCLPKKQ